MFSNAMTFKPPETVFHKQAKTLQNVAKKLVELGRQGVCVIRGKTAQIVRAHNDAIKAEVKAERDKRRAEARAEKAAARAAMVAELAAASGINLNSLANAKLDTGTSNPGPHPIPQQQQLPPPMHKQTRMPG